MSHALTDDNFLAQIKKTEEQAKTKLTKATKKLATDLSNYEQKLQKNLEAKLDKARDKSKDKLKAKQADARKTYEAQVSEGSRNVKQLEKDAEGAVKKQMPQAQAYFLELLG